MNPEATGGDGALADRRAKLARLRDAGIEPFPHAYPGVEPIAEVRAAHADLEAGAETEDRHRVAGRLAARREQGKAAWLDVVDRSGRIQLHAKRDVLGDDEFAHLLDLDLGDIVGVRRSRLRLAARRADAGRRGLRPAGQVVASAAGQVPRRHGHGDALPAPRARPHRERGDPRAVRGPRSHHLRRAPLPRRRRVPRGGDARSPAAVRRRARAPVHHAAPRARPHALPADRDRALPQAADRGRPRPCLRDRQGLPQRGPVHEAQPRVHDARVVRGLRRLRRRRQAARGRSSAPRPAPSTTRASCGSPSRGGG